MSFPTLPVLVSALALAGLVVGACAEFERDLVSSEFHGDASLVVAEFSGVFDPATGTFSLRLADTDRSVQNLDSGLVTARSALYCSGLPVGPGGVVSLEVAAGSIGFTAEECIPADELEEWAELAYDDGGVFCLDVAATSAFDLP
jgi:hypothetical protein